MVFNGAEHPPLVPAAVPYPEIVTQRIIPTSPLPTSAGARYRPFPYDPKLVEVEYRFGEFDIEVRAKEVSIGLNDDTSWGAFVLGSQELDDFLTVLNYHHAKAKGEIGG